MERDLGVLVDKQLNMSEQFVGAAKKANTRFGCTNTRRGKVTIALYSVLVRTHPEYSVQFLSLLYMKDVDGVEKVQERATMSKLLGSLSHEKRLRKPYHRVPILKEWLLRRWRCPFHKESYKKVRSDLCKLCLGRFNWTQEENFRNENDQPLE